MANTLPKMYILRTNGQILCIVFVIQEVLVQYFQGKVLEKSLCLTHDAAENRRLLGDEDIFSIALVQDTCQRETSQHYMGML